MQTRQLGPDGPVVTRIGFGAMHLSLAGRPREEDAVRALHLVLDSGVTLIDTANVYCVDDSDIGHNERIIARALASWGGDRSRIVVATKGGLRRPKGAWTSDARPEALRAACEASLRDLGRDVIDVYQLHAPDPKVPLADTMGALARLRDEGKIRHVGVSNFSVKEIETARAIVPVLSVQNRFSPTRRDSETNGVVAHCEKHGIAFLPYSPFGGSSAAPTLGTVGSLDRTAAGFGVSPHRLVLAWMLAKFPHFFPIPGGRRLESIRDCVGADGVQLTQADIAKVEASFG
ncbi:aldo/keto reductase [Pendulispora albinea]|uniref:Aldo/keto reductase n=1 Tax=Pendulispora albinea TaxID=2741071 RepID=A0ABZ2LT23_9BACT